MTRSQVEQTFTGVIARSGCRAAPVSVHMLWRSEDPATLSLLVDPDGKQILWEVSRETFVAAGRKPFEGCWVGAGDFAVLISPHGACRMAFKSRTLKTITFILLDGTGVPPFLAHTLSHVPQGDEESQIIAEQVEAAIERVLNA